MRINKFTKDESTDLEKKKKKREKKKRRVLYVSAFCVGWGISVFAESVSAVFFLFLYFCSCCDQPTNIKKRKEKGQAKI